MTNQPNLPDCEPNGQQPCSTEIAGKPKVLRQARSRIGDATMSIFFKKHLALARKPLTTKQCHVTSAFVVALMFLVLPQAQDAMHYRHAAVSGLRTTELVMSLTDLRHAQTVADALTYIPFSSRNSFVSDHLGFSADEARAFVADPKSWLALRSKNIDAVAAVHTATVSGQRRRELAFALVCLVLMMFALACYSFFSWRYIKESRTGVSS